LGALRAQLDLGLAAIGGKDSMSGSFEDMDVPPTLVSFARRGGGCRVHRIARIQARGLPIALLSPDYDENGLPTPASLKKIWNKAQELLRSGGRFPLGRPYLAA
jgi:phosphoribosylformylglycinamidine synthase